MKQYCIKIFIALIGAALLLTACKSTKSVDNGQKIVCNCNKAVRVPDKTFRTFLLDKGYAVKAGWHKMRPTAKGCSLTILECFEQGIKSLEGIEMFPQLEQVVCSDNPITNLDLNGLPYLKKLYGLNLPLQDIHIEQCHDLCLIDLSHTKLDTFDLTPFPNLEEFFCIFTDLRHIDLTPCPSLRLLYIRGTQIREVDLTPCPSLEKLHARDTPLEKVIVTPEQHKGSVGFNIENGVQVVVAPAP